MPTAAKFELERQELSSVLESGIFNRAPGLAQLLIYICEKFFEGEGAQIKEYNVAVEALGRPAEFDQKRDSIVRVEAHRLRKRLKDYYQAAGAGHALKIVIPPGQYAPRFQLHEQLLLPDLLPKPLDAPESPRVQFTAIPVRRAASRLLPAYIVGGLILFGAAAVVIAARSGSVPSHAYPADSPVDAAVPAGDEVRILAGSGKPYTDHFGRIWQADRDFVGGSVFSDPLHFIIGTRDPLIYQSGRNGSFRYDIPLRNGTYELRLHFAETVFGDPNEAGGGETSRLFNVFANGKLLLEMIDVIADAGPNAADIRVFKDLQPAPDGFLHLEYKPVVNEAFLNAIEIAPGTPGRLRPIRIVARDHPYVDRRGRAWAADRYFQGGQLVVRSVSVSDAPDPEIYRGERFGNLTYQIPVAPGRYTVVLHFAETWFGPGKLQHGGAGSRSFDLLCNGVALQQGLDIFREAGGPDRALRKAFHGLEPNAQGKLVLSFVPRRNYSCINAIEVLDEAR